MKKAVFISILFLLIFIGKSFSQQIKGFPNESEDFLNKYSQMLQKYSSDKKATKIFIDSLTIVWENGMFTDDMKKTVYKTANSLTKKRALPFPHYNNYIQSVYEFVKTNHDFNSYLNWDKALNYMIDEKKITIRGIDDFLDMSVNLLATNSIYKSPSTEWRASNNDFKFKFDKSTVKIIFGETDITCYAKQDSVKILQTKGVYYPLEKNKWEGVNGVVTWERAGFKPNEVYANLYRYEISMNQSKYEADSVSFVNTFYFNKPLLGSFEEKVMKITSAEKATYPRFESFTKRFQIKNIYENVDYDGGFSMSGAKFIGSGSKEEPALLYFYRNDEIFLTASSKLYAFRKDRITGTNTAITFRLDTDSIYHAGLLFKYDVPKRQVELIRDGQGLSNSPYFNTYHNITMDFESLVWNVDDPKMDFKMMTGSSNNKATFESTNYFSEWDFNKIQMMDQHNPIVVVKKFVDYYGFPSFSASELANYMKMDLNMVRRMLINLTFLGLIDYDFDIDQITVKQRMYDYLSSHAGKIDYDVIDFISETDGSENASLNLLNFDLEIFGVREIQLSDSQDVRIYPADEKILIKENLDFEFDGKLFAGKFIFTGKDFDFEYDNFKINLNNVDSLRLQAETGQTDYYGNKQVRNVKTLIENVRGDLLIDNPKNKSGIKDFPEYPIFNSKKDSYVYYDRRSILEGTYKRDNFYFQIYPYTIDSLDNFTREGLRFAGYFVSGGIFPPFEEDLTLQKDFSLGFIRSTPPEGFPLYGGKGTFHNDIKLSNDGLRGDGEFKYVTSTTFSDNFIFFPDSMYTIAQKMHIEKQESGVEFPTVDALSCKVIFRPHDDELLTSKKEVPIAMFDGQALHHGTLKLKPEALTGWGMMEFTKAELYSNEFKYNLNTVDADTSDFKLKALDMTGFAFKTDNVNAHVDFEARTGEFVSNGEGSFVEFPQNQYMCFMDQFIWYMDDEEIEVSSSKKKDAIANTEGLSPMEIEDIQLEGSEFISTHPDQDSLKFVAPSAKFNMRKNIIRANEVKYIRTADATVYLNDGEVIVEKGAKMRTLSNTKIIANNTSRYHTIYNSTANIYGKKDYTAAGDYDYLDENNTKQTIHFDMVAVDSTIQTYAKGKIGITDNFTLSPNYTYTGDVKLFANNQFLTFSGATKIAHECERFGNYWLKFESEINPNQIYIPVDSTLKDINNNTLLAGIIQTTDTFSIYSAFLTKHKGYSDFSVLPVSGYLYYDKNSKKYKISSKEKIVEINLPGNYLSLHKDICSIYGEGKMDLGANLGQIKSNTVGSVIHSYDQDTKDFDLLMTLDFMFHDPALKILSEAINSDVTLEAVNLTSKTYEKGMTEILGKEVADKLKTEIYTYGAFKKLPDELEKTIFFNQLKMTWNDDMHAYVSQGKIGIGNILKTQVNKLVDGYVYFERKRSGDILNIYLEIDKANWFYFVYERGQMLAVSSNNDFNVGIRDLKLDKRKMEVAKGEMPYSFYILSSPRKKDMFLRKMEGGEEEIEGSETDE